MALTAARKETLIGVGLSTVAAVALIWYARQNAAPATATVQGNSNVTGAPTLGQVGLTTPQQLAGINPGTIDFGGSPFYQTYNYGTPITYGANGYALPESPELHPSSNGAYQGGACCDDCAPTAGNTSFGSVLQSYTPEYISSILTNNASPNIGGVSRATPSPIGDGSEAGPSGFFPLPQNGNSTGSAITRPTASVPSMSLSTGDSTYRPSSSLPSGSLDEFTGTIQ